MNKYIVLIFLPAFALMMSPAMAQNLNWAGLKENEKHLFHVHAGMEYGAEYGLGYSYRIKNKFFPLVAGIEYSAPAGNRVLDDFKSKAGGQIRWLAWRDVQFSTRIQGVFRRHENDFVRLLNFGSDMAGVLGYYRPQWFLAAEAGFDKAIVTHFKHAAAYREIYARVVDGWYEPASGGNFYYGVQAGFSYKRQDIGLKAGKILSQDFTTKPYLPFYVQLSYTVKF
ncbi:MAG: hypothetical protein JNL88_10865 [Bacteroidia bacterium]|nr:hypothetical protein [Bacteroidia bacterium]